LAEYESKDSRIKIIDKENGGQSDARNKGIDNAKGKYLVFIDSDDYILPCHIETLFNLISKYNCEMGVSPFALVNENECIPFHDREKATERLYNPIECIEEMFYQHQIESTIPTKIYLKELFDNHRFKKGLIFEDLFILPDLMLACKNIAYTSICSYAYIMHDNSTEGSGFSEKKYQSVFEVVNKIDSDTRLKSIKKAVDCRLLSIISRLYFSMPINHPQKNFVWKEMKKRRKGVLFNSRARMKNRLITVLMYLGPRLTTAVYRIIKTR
jgi:glycosyltransferase involved in cell wall biosynthesis